MARDGGMVERLAGNTNVLGLYTKLVGIGISKHYVRGFLEKGGAFEKDFAIGGRAMRRSVINAILSEIEVIDPFSGNGDKQVVAAFVGPTGVGKTTTIAKLAADIGLKEKRRVGFISIDNYRVGAMEQLKTYATILGVPCFPAFNRSDLKLAMSRLRDKDIVLIDTAGQSHYDTARMKELAGLIGTDGSITCHLLLSTTINQEEMSFVGENFGMLNVDSYVFTKIDETKSRGVIINQLLTSGVPASYITTGQRVPEDLLKATKAGILSLMFQ